VIELLSDPQVWIAFFTLTALELVLGIDNIVFISILAEKLPAAQRDLARRAGLFLAMFLRIGLLFLLSWVVGLTEPLFTITRYELSGRDLILIAGGLFLLFSLDSIITAVGMVDELAVMVAAVVVSVALMMAFSGAIARVIAAHPTLKMLALAFLFVVGVVLIADGFDHHVPKGYVYFAMAFSLAVELLNIRIRKRVIRPSRK
jgi:predicted tellurium resistance membrane protein TerC